MGRSRQPRPKHLARKLREIRLRLGLTQPEMFELLKHSGATLFVGHISLYETDQRVPPLMVLLRYARAAQVPMEVLVDDLLKLPQS